MDDRQRFSSGTPGYQENIQSRLNLGYDQDVELYLTNGHVIDGRVSHMVWMGNFPYAVTIISPLSENRGYKRTILMQQVVEIRPRLKKENHDG